MTGEPPAPPLRRSRLFVACDLPEEAERAVAAWQRRELAQHRDLRVSEALHVTLVFLGDVDAARIPDVERSLGGIVWPAASCRFSAPLFLPAHGRRRVVALALDDEAGILRDLQGRVAAGLAAAGLHEPERRAWLPHVTVARFRRPGQPFSLQNVTIGEFGVVRMVLYSSALKPTGAVHTPIAVYPAS